MDYARFLSEVAKRRTTSPLRYFAKYLLNPSQELVNMSAGYPNPQTFPFESMTINLKNPNDKPIVISDKMPTALQYHKSQGYNDLLDWLMKLQITTHKPPISSSISDEGRMGVMVTPGTQDAISKCFECLLNPGDSVLLEEPTYPGSLAFMQPLQYKFLTVNGDTDGMIPQSLRNVMKKWPAEYCRTTISSNVPRLLYTIPTAGNPTGTTISNDRKKEIYKIAQEYDLIIMEDDPYYFLHFGKELPNSFLSLDTDGRVIRTDSFSKIFSAGMRVGFITGPNAVLDRIRMHMESTVIQTSSLLQIMISELLYDWGIDGFMKHIEQIQKFYVERRDLTLKYADKWLAGLAEWNVPSGGMFLWIKIPSMTDTTKFAREYLVEKELIVAPGNVFMCDNSAPCQYIRVSFSFAEEKKIDAGFQRLAEGIKNLLKQ